MVTRKYTLDTAHALLNRVQKTAGDVPVIFVFNKSDLIDSWEIEPSQLASLEHQGAVVIRTSAKDGSGVESAFTTLGGDDAGGVDRGLSSRHKYLSD